jgi:hypothetical protein
MPDTLPVARFQDTLPRQQTNYAPSHIGTDPLAYLPDRAADRLRRLQLSADDLHAVIPEFEQVREANAARMEADTRLKRLLAPQSSGGFNLPEDDLRVTVARRELAEKTRAADRLNALDAERTTTWRTASQTLSAINAWLVEGRPAGTVLEAIEVEPPKLNKGETVVDAIGRLRRRGRELRADIARFNAAPFPLSYCKAQMKAQIEALAQTGTPDVTMLIEHDRDVTFQTQRLQSSVHADRQTLLAFTEVPDTVALFAWLHKDALIARLDAEIAAEADDATALTHAEREKREAEAMADLLAVERDEAALVWRAQSENLPVEHRSDVSPLALLGLRLVTAASGNGAAGSSWQHAFDVIGLRR